MLNTAPFAAANQANLDALTSLTNKAIQGVERLTALNLGMAKDSLDDVIETSRAVQSAKDPQALLNLQAGLLQPAAEKAAAYGREVFDIVSSTRADVEKLAARQAASAQELMTAAVEAAAQSAPEGSGSGVALFKQAMAAANNAIDGLQKASRQAAEVAEANVAAVTGSVMKATEKAAAKARRG